MPTQISRTMGVVHVMDLLLITLLPGVADRSLIQLCSPAAVRLQAPVCEL